MNFFYTYGVKAEKGTSRMEDSQIVDLYFARQECALSESQKKYGRMLLGLAMSLLRDLEDSKECENDTYLTAWNKIPPDKPMFLGAYLSKITRFISLNLLRKRTAEKRTAENEALEELAECLSTGETAEDAFVRGQLKETLNSFVRSLPAEQRFIFVRRYFYAQPVPVIARDLSFSEGKVKTALFRIRAKLKKALEKEGWT